MLFISNYKPTEVATPKKNIVILDPAQLDWVSGIQYLYSTPKECKDEELIPLQGILVP